MKHALYQITKNIPPPAVSLKSRQNGLAHLIRTMKKGDSMLIPHKQLGSAKNAAHRERISLAHQRIGIGKTTRIWHMGKLPEQPIDSTDTKVKAGKKPWSKKSDYWSPKNAAMRSANAKLAALRRAQNRVAAAEPKPKRKYTRRHAKLTPRLPRAAGAPLFTGPEARPE